MTGVMGTGTGEEFLEVQALSVLNGTLYVGGRFRYVQQGASGTKTEQPYLAAFDAKSGEWRSTFLPKLDGQVWDIEPLGNKIIIAGEFTNVDGEPNTAGMAALDPATGKVVPGWRTTFTRASGLPVKVKALDTQDGWLYVGGAFNHVSGGNPLSAKVWSVMGARVRVTDGRPDETWTPASTCPWSTSTPARRATASTSAASSRTSTTSPPTASPCSPPPPRPRWSPAWASGSRAPPPPTATTASRSPSTATASGWAAPSTTSSSTPATT
nr:hypothetical protein GCM10020093_082990 [Planobispora longispora]